MKALSIIISTVAILTGIVQQSTQAGALSPYPLASEHTQLANTAQLMLFNTQKAASNTTEQWQLSTQIGLALNIYSQLLFTESMLRGNIMNSQSIQAGHYEVEPGILATDLADEVDTIRNLSYAAKVIASEYADRYPGYDEYMKAQSGNRWSVKETIDEHERIDAAARSNVEAALNALNIQYDKFSSEDDLLESLRKKSRNAIGRQQLLQVGNELAIQNARQMQDLRALLMTQAQFEINHQASQASEAAAERALVDINLQALQDAEDREIVIDDGTVF